MTHDCKIGSEPRASQSVRLILLLALLTALDALATDLYLPGMPAIAKEFGASPARTQQTLSIFLIGLALGQAIYGPLLDRYGRRAPLLAGIGLFVLGSVQAAWATSIEWLLVARLLQALGAAGGLVTPRAVIADLYDVRQSSRIFSLLMQVMMIAPIMAPLLGGYLMAHGGWRLLFWALAVFGFLGLIWAVWDAPETLPPEKRMPLSIGHVTRAYVRQLLSPAYIAYTVAGGFILGSLFAYIGGAAFIFVERFSLAPMQFSYVFALTAVSVVLGGYFGNRLLRRNVRETRSMYAGIMVHIAGTFLLSVLVWMGLAPLWVYAGLLIVGIGALGLVFGNLAALTMAHAGPRIGVASALMGSLQYLMSAVIGYLVSLAGTDAVLLPLCMSICGGLALVSCGLAARGR